MGRGLTADERRVRFEGRDYPLEVGDAEAMRDAIGRAVAAMGRRPGARGRGNADERPRIVVASPAMSALGLAGLLAGR